MAATRVIPESDNLSVSEATAHRLEALPIGTRVVLTSGRTATIIAKNCTRVTVRVDSGAEHSVAPAAELPVADERFHESDTWRPSTDGLETDRHDRREMRGMRQVVTAGPMDHPPGPDASRASAAAEATQRSCANCGALFIPRRPWQRFCRRGCRQALYESGLQARERALISSATDRAEERPVQVLEGID